MSQATAKKNDPSQISAISIEAEISERMRALIDACQKGDSDRVFSFYAPDVIVYDCPPKLRLRGRKEYRQSFDKWFISAFEFPVKYEVREEKVIASGDLATVHGLTNVKGRFKENGEVMSVWLRHTAIFQKTSGMWLITHEHFSVPVGEDGRALMGLEPDKDREV